MAKSDVPLHHSIIGLRNMLHRQTGFVMLMLSVIHGSSTESYVGFHEQNLGEGFAFTTCANSGRTGPTQYQCNTAYKSSEVTVQVLDKTSKPPLPGVQVWTVPETTQYSITALGAGGGAGVRNPKPVKGAYVHAKFNFTKGEKIYLLIGQPGSSACSQSNQANPLMKEICTNGTSNNQSAENLGGGGGGGATYVFKVDNSTGEFIPLIVAAGGGGNSFLKSDMVPADGGLGLAGQNYSASTPPQGPGAGGGWFNLLNHVRPQAGQAPLEGGQGGRPCPRAEIEGWQISGGFGGGGGGCSAGGGGGGYSGGNVSVLDQHVHNGQGGLCYVDPNGTSARIEPAASPMPDGEVEIAFVLDCPCEFMCIFKDYDNQDFKCYCAPNFVLAADGLSCLGPLTSDDLDTDPGLITERKKMKEVSWVAIVGVAGGCFVVFLACALYCGFCIMQQRSKRQGTCLRLEQTLSNPDYQLDRLRSTHTTSTMMTEYNPNYDFGDAKYTIQDLREIPRENLSFVKALGQGAFGEVYQGNLANVQDEPASIRVAVKTLPALCTDQAEMDFLMEALIMSKFSHPNIVRFIGVCFEKHPRYIILELLEGGDLKTFLRESRPKPGRPSRVTMLDLVKLSLDVAKGCQYLEENRFIHRDIAARNCLLTTKDSNRVAKIADFGMARDIYRADYYRKGGKAMLPVKWMPPEAFLDGFFSSKTDVWSFGILLWEVFSMGYMPYPGCGNHEVMQLVTAGGRLEPPNNCPKPIYQIMKMCSHGVPERRPNFATIIEQLQHCMQDPDVVHSPLPVFHQPAAIERHNSLSAPSHPLPGRTPLSGSNSDSSSQYLPPDTPSSIQPLIGPQSPAVDITLEEETGFGGQERRTTGSENPAIFRYDDLDEHDEEMSHLEPLMNHIEPALGDSGRRFEPTNLTGQSSPARSRDAHKQSVIGGGYVSGKGGESDANETALFLNNTSQHCDPLLDVSPQNCSSATSHSGQQQGGEPEYSNVSRQSLASSDADRTLSCHSLPHHGSPSAALSASSIRKTSSPHPPHNPASQPQLKCTSNHSLPPLQTDAPLERARSTTDTRHEPPGSPLRQQHPGSPLQGPLYVNTQFGNNKSLSALSQCGANNHNALVPSEASSKSAATLSSQS